jgi:hypothetical protein
VTQNVVSVNPEGFIVDMLIYIKDRFIMSSEVIMSNTNKQKKPDFSIEFKQSAARLANEKGLCIRHIPMRFIFAN